MYPKHNLLPFLGQNQRSSDTSPPLQDSSVKSALSPLDNHDAVIIMIAPNHIIVIVFQADVIDRERDRRLQWSIAYRLFVN